GFLITGLLFSGAAKRGYVSFVDFYVRRARRILPAATLTLVVTTIVAHHLLNYVRAKQVVWDSFWASLFAANIRFAQQGTAYFSTFARAWELAMGAALALVTVQVARIPAQCRAALGWLGVAAIGCAAVLYSETTPFPGYAALLPTIGTAAVIAAGTGERKPR